MNLTVDTFGIHQCTLTKVVKDVCSALLLFMVPKLIKLPNYVRLLCNCALIKPVYLIIYEPVR